MKRDTQTQSAMIHSPAKHKPHLDRLAMGLLVACCAYWGFQQILIKLAMQEMAPMWQATLRFAAATVLLWLWCRWRQIPLFLRDGSLWHGLLAGALFAGEFAGIYFGLQLTTVSRLTVFLYTAPLVVALLLPIWVPSERLRSVQWVGLFVAFVSVVVAFSEGLGQASSTQLMGDAVALAAGVCWGLTTLLIRSSRLVLLSAEKILFYQVAVTAVLAPLVSWALAEPWRFVYSPLTWASLLLQAVVGAFASYLTWTWMLRHYPVTQMSSYVFLTPMFALLFGVGLLGEHLTVQLVLAFSGVAAGIVLVSRRT
jgi:drug/metabolite transporter (DMT)-like permease